MRTNEGWFRVDASGAQPTSILEKPKKAPQGKRQRCPEDSFIDCAPKRQDRKHALELDVLSHDNVSQVPTSLLCFFLSFTSPCLNVGDGFLER